MSQGEGIRSSILSTGESPDAQSRALSIALNHREIASIMAVTGTISPEQHSNVITRHEQNNKYCHMQHLLEIKENKQKTEFFFHIQYCVHCDISNKENIS